MPSYLRGRSNGALALLVLACLACLTFGPGPASGRSDTRLTKAQANNGPTRTDVLNSKSVARKIFKTPCRWVKVEIRARTPDPDALGQAIAPCRVFIRRSHYTFGRICMLIVHEYGHLAGFRHSTDPSDIMHPARPLRYSPCVRHQALMQRKAARAER